MNNIILNLQLACADLHNLPKKSIFRYWLREVLPLFCKKAEITIRIVDIIEGRALNMIYCGKNYPTNVLSFSFDTIILSKKLPLLGDIVICRQIVESEALHQNKILEAHWGHIVIHGILHLLGYDHLSYQDSKKMKSLEIKIMRNLGYPNPY